MSEQERTAITYRDRALREALVGPDHFRRYHTSPSFKSAIDTLAKMLPAWVEGLAAQSDGADHQMELALEAARNAPIGPFPTPDQNGREADRG